MDGGETYLWQILLRGRLSDFGLFFESGLGCWNSEFFGGIFVLAIRTCGMCGGLLGGRREQYRAWFLHSPSQPQGVPRARTAVYH